MSNGSYHKHLLANFLKSRVNLLKAASQGNSYLADTVSQAVGSDELEQAKRNLDMLRNDGFAPLKVFQRFKMADMLDFYRSAYAHVSSDVHGDISALTRSHFDDDDDGKVVLYRECQVDERLHEIDAIIRELVDLSVRVHERFKSAALNDVARFRDHMHILLRQGEPLDDVVKP